MLNLKNERTLWWVLGSILLLRLVGLGIYPLMDTSEARYAEMARKMVELNDWITPMFDYGVPFWGKPPLSFWTQAASMTVFGVNEFAARFPAWHSTWQAVSSSSNSARSRFLVTPASGLPLFFPAPHLAWSPAVLC